MAGCICRECPSSSVRCLTGPTATIAAAMAPMHCARNTPAVSPLLEVAAAAGAGQHRDRHSREVGHAVSAVAAAAVCEGDRPVHRGRAAPHWPGALDLGLLNSEPPGRRHLTWFIAKTGCLRCRAHRVCCAHATVSRPCMVACTLPKVPSSRDLTVTFRQSQRHGAALEVVTSRMRLIASQVPGPIRIVGLCTSLANAKDLGEWIGASSHSLFNFPPGAAAARPLMQPACSRLSTCEQPASMNNYLCICKHARLLCLWVQL